MLAKVRTQITKVPFLVILAFASLVSLATQAVAYSGVSGLKSVWSGVTGWNTIGDGSWGLFTLDNSFISPSVSTTAIMMPIVFGASLLIILLMGVSFAITRSYQAVLIVAIAGIIGIMDRFRYCYSY